MEDKVRSGSIFLLQHPLADPQDPPIAIPTRPRPIPLRTAGIPPTPTSLSQSFSPPGSPVLSPFHGPSSLPLSSSSFLTGTGGISGVVGAASCSVISASSARQSTRLARELTTRLWQREAELHTMKERYDAKIEKLKSMLQEAGVSPTEVENSLAEAETTTTSPTPSPSPSSSSPPPLHLLVRHEPHLEQQLQPQQQLHDRSNHHSHRCEQKLHAKHHHYQCRPIDYPTHDVSSLSATPREVVQSTPGQQGMEDCDPLSFSRETLATSSRGACEDCLSIGDREDGVGEEDDNDGDLEQALSEAMSSCSNSIISTRLLSSNDGSCSAGGQSDMVSMSSEQPGVEATRISAGAAKTIKGGHASILASSSDTSCARTEKDHLGSRSTTLSAPTLTATSVTQQSCTNSTTTTPTTTTSAPPTVERDTNNNNNVHTNADDLSTSVPQQSTESSPAHTPSTTVGSLGIKALREKWASGAFFWSRSTLGAQPPSDSHLPGHHGHHHHSASTSAVTGSGNIFARTQGMVDEKKPALVETINPSPSGSAAAATVSTSINEGTVPATTTRDPWLESIFGPTSTSSVSPTSSSRKLHFTRPMSEIHYGTNSHPHFATLAQPTTQRDNPLSRQTLTRIYEGTGALSSSPPPEPAPSLPRSNPSPLHFRAISMAANLIGTGAITPAKLYAKRTHTLIAKWTLGLLMNSRDRNGHGNGFPIIREAACPEQEVKMRPSNSSSGSNGACVEDKDRWAQDQDEDEDIIHPLLSPRTLSPRLLSPRLYGSSGGSGSGNSSSLANFGGSTSNSSGGGGCGGGGSGPVSHMSMGSSMYSSYHSNSMAPPISDRSVVEMSDISSPTRSLSPSSSFSGFSGGFGGGESKPTTDRYGFYTNARPVAVQQGLLKLTEAYTIEELDTPKSQADGSERDTFDFAKPCESPKSGHSHPPSIHAGLEGYQTSVITVATTVTTTATVTATATTKSSFSGDGIAAATASLTSSISAGGAGPSLSTYSITSSVLSTTAPRPTSTLSTPVAPTTTVTAILSQLKDLHDSVQMSQKEKWDAFLRKRRRKLHQGELHGNMSSSNLGSPLFSSLSLTLEEDQPEDDDWLYWSSQQLIGLATMGKGADWEEFRDLVRGGIPVVYRNKIWMEASGAWDMRQPGYYQELLSAIRPEQSPCWSDIEMDLHRTFPTNILFGYGGQGIDKLRNLLTAYAIYNPTVGYCQGMNLLAGTLLLTNHSEEDAFWVLTCILGRLLPADYFTKQLLAPQADQRVLRELVQEIMPRLSSHLDEMHVDLTAITFSWFLTLFTDCLPVETLVRVWDVLFVEGMLAVFRIAVALLWLNEKEIIKCRNGATIYCYMKQMTQGMHQADKLLKTAMVTLKSAIHPDKVEAKRIRYNKQIREEHIREEQLLQESAARRRRSKSPPPQQPPPLSSALLPSTAKELSLTPSNTTTTSTDAADVSATTLSPTSPSPQVATTTSMDNEPVGSPRATSPPRYIPRSPGSAQSTRPLRAV